MSSFAVTVITNTLTRGHGLGDQSLERQLLLLEVVSSRILDLELAHGLAEALLDLLLLAALQLKGESGVRHDLLNTGDVGLELLLSLEALAERLVVALELLGLADHVLDLAGRELANGVGNGNVGGAAGGLLGGGDLEETVDVDLEDDLKDGLTSLHGRNGSKGEFTERGVILAVDTDTLVDREGDGLLVVGNSGEGSLLDSGDGLATGNDRGEDVALHSDTKIKGNDVQKKEVSSVGRGSFAGEDTSLDSGTVGNSLVGVDALLELLAIEEVDEEFLDAGNTGGTTDKDDLVDLALLEAGILEDLGNGLKGAGERLGVDVLKTSTGDLGVEILAVEERVDLNGGLSTAGEGTLGTLASGSQSPESTGITGKILLGLSLELLLEVEHEVLFCRC